jgi:hypothetical protein
MLDRAKVSNIFIFNFSLAQLIAIQDFGAINRRKTFLSSSSFVTSSPISTL